MFETLFWKVYNNKFIRANIFHQIEQVQHIDEKRIKFKDINKLEWMLNNKQYQLIKCKILNGEYIEVNRNKSMRLLFSMDQETIDLELQLFKDILQLVLNDEIINKESVFNDLLSNAFEFSNLKTCNILFEWLNTLVDLEPTYSNNIFRRIIYNKNHQCELLKHFSTILSKIKKQDHQLSNFHVYALIDTPPNAITLKELKRGLANYIFKNNIISNNNQDTIETLFIYIRLFKNSKDPIPLPNSQDENETIKQLLKEFIILSNSKKLYKYYLEHYDESITWYNNDNTTLNKSLKIQHCKYTFKHLSFNTIDSIEFDHFDLLEYGYRYKTKKPTTQDIFYKTNEIISSNMSRSIQFLKQYFLKLGQFQSHEEKTLKPLTIYLIFNILFAIKSNESYEQVLSLIPISVKEYIPIGWDPIILEFNNNNGPIIIKDCATIDWLKHCYDIIKAHCDLIYFIVVLNPCYQTVKLAKYAYGLCKYGLQVDYYGHLFNKAIKECNFDTIIEIKSVLTQSLKIDIDILSKYKFKGQTSSNDCIDDYNQLFNYIISEKMVEPLMIFKLIEYIVNNGWYSNQDKSTFYFDLSRVNINLSLNQNWQVKILYHLNNVKYIQFIIENVQTSKLDGSFSTIYINNFTSTQAIDSIHIFIDGMDKKLEHFLLNSTSPSDLSNELSIYYKYLNLIFFQLLKCVGTTINQVNQMYELIYIKSKVPICIPQTGYHHFQFISLKSSILSSFLQESKISKIFGTLSFECIYNSSFDEILKYSTTIDGSLNELDTLYQINLNLHLFLNLKRIDLFFNQLDYCDIKSVQFNHLLIEQSCILMDLESIIKITNISNFQLNKLFFLKMTIITLKLSKYSNFKHLFKYSISCFNDGNNDDKEFVNYINNNITGNDDLFLKSNQKLLIHKINKFINQIK